MGSPAARGAALCRSQRSMAALCRGCRVVSRREMGEASRGRSDGSIGSCRDRHAPKGTGRGLLEAKIFGLPTFGARRGLVGRGEVRGVSSACEPGAKAGPPYFTICCSRRPGAQLIRCKSPNFRPALRSSTCHRSSLLAPAFRRRGASRDSLGPQKQTSRSSRALTLAGSAQRMFARWHPSQA